MLGMVLRLLDYFAWYGNAFFLLFFRCIIMNLKIIKSSNKFDKRNRQKWINYIETRKLKFKFERRG